MTYKAGCFPQAALTVWKIYTNKGGLLFCSLCGSACHELVNIKCGTLPKTNLGTFVSEGQAEKAWQLKHQIALVV